MGDQGNRQQQVVRVNLPKPYKLNHKDITLDKLDGWWTILNSFAGSDPRYVKFMVGGANVNWIPADEDATRGLAVAAVYPQAANADQRQAADDAAAAATNRLRAELQELLSLIGSYSPEGLFRPITQESSNLRWVLDTIKNTFNLHTRGENLVAGLCMTYSKSEETYQQFYMRLRSFHMESLLPVGTFFKGRQLAAPESISPLAEAMIVNMWLTKIDPRLPNHVRATKGFLFTEDKPTLACVQPQLNIMMTTMLAELESESNANRVSMEPTDQDTLNVSRISSFQASGNRPFNQFRTANTWQGNRGGRGGFSYRGNRGGFSRGGAAGQQSRRTKLCTKCYEAGRAENIYSSHDTEACTGGPRIRYVTIPVQDWNDEQEQYQVQELDFDNLVLNSDGYYQHNPEETQQQEI